MKGKFISCAIFILIVSCGEKTNNYGTPAADIAESSQALCSDDSINFDDGEVYLGKEISDFYRNKGIIFSSINSRKPRLLNENWRGQEGEAIPTSGLFTLGADGGGFNSTEPLIIEFIQPVYSISFNIIDLEGGSVEIELYDKNLHKFEQAYKFKADRRLKSAEPLHIKIENINPFKKVLIRPDDASVIDDLSFSTCVSESDSQYAGEVTSLNYPVDCPKEISFDEFVGQDGNRLGRDIDGYLYPLHGINFSGKLMNEMISGVEWSAVPVSDPYVFGTNSSQAFTNETPFVMSFDRPVKSLNFYVVHRGGTTGSVDYYDCNDGVLGRQDFRPTNNKIKRIEIKNDLENVCKVKVSGDGFFIDDISYEIKSAFCTDNTLSLKAPLCHYEFNFDRSE